MWSTSKILNGNMTRASAAVALLGAEQGVLVGPVVGQVAQVGAPWNVGPVVDLGEEDAELVAEAGLDEVRHHLRAVDADYCASTRILAVWPEFVCS